MVLIPVVEYGELPEMLRVADVLKSHLQQDVTFFFAKRHYRRLEEDSREVIARGHRWMDWRGELQQGPAVRPPDDAETGGAAAESGRSTSWLRALTGDLIALVRDFASFRRRYREVARVVGRMSPALLVVGQDLLGKELSFALVAARRAGIPTMIVPFAMFSRRELVEYAASRPEHSVQGRPLNRLLAAWYPRWVAEHAGRRLLRLPGSRGLALELAGLVGGDPWVPCSEPAGAVACESEVAMRAFREAGIDAAALHVVGGPVHDRLAAALAEGREGRARLMARHRLDPGRPLLVCGWPANIFAWLGSRTIEYGSYAQLADAWARILARMRERFGIQVLASVHPKTLDAELAAPRAASIPCQKGVTEQAVAHGDLFVTLLGSSITAWAIACRKPVLLFDCYRTGYPDFDGVPGCVVTRNEAAFSAELDRLCADEGRRACLSAAQAAVANAWGELDGRSAERLAALSARLIAAAT